MNLFTLIRLAVTILKRDPEDRLKGLLRLADGNPEDSTAQEFAAREAWRQGHHEAAYKHAQRAVSLDPDSLAPLRILAEKSVEGGNDTEAYEYARRLLTATRIDKQAEPWIRLALTPFGLFPSYRLRFQKFFENYVPKNDEWVAWAEEYVEWYESQAQTPTTN